RGAHAGLFFFSSRRRHTRSYGDWSSDVCSSDLWKKPVRKNPSTGIEHEDKTMFAVIKTGGKQYRVAVEDKLKVEKVAGEPGEIRSEERRVGREWRSRWGPDQ